jgi:hypothetical protein
MRNEKFDKSRAFYKGKIRSRLSTAFVSLPGFAFIKGFFVWRCNEQINKSNGSTRIADRLL